MTVVPETQKPTGHIATEAVIEHFRSSLEDGREWPSALMEAMALWTNPEEIFCGQHFSYFIGGEAFDWLLLAERLFVPVHDLIPRIEKETLLFLGCFPSTLIHPNFENILGVDKYRAYLNYYYGVVVEGALQLAVELELQKRYASNGIQYKHDFSEEAFVKIYGSSSLDLMRIFRGHTTQTSECFMSVAESKEFTYWLFKYRIEMSDKARVASDTNKGLKQLSRMKNFRIDK